MELHLPQLLQYETSNTIISEKNMLTTAIFLYIENVHQGTW